MRKTIARRLTESKQQVPHIYLTVDIQLDALLKLRGELNAGLESRGVKLSVNDLLIKALAQALMEVPECNVTFAGDHMTPLQAIQAATINASEALGRNDVGVIEVGRYGDLVAVDGDPLTNVRVLEKPAAVIKGGQLINRD